MMRTGIRRIEDETKVSDFMAKTLSDQRTKFVEDLMSVHPGLAAWAAGEFERGFDINGVKNRIIAAAMVARPGHDKWPAA